MLISASLMVLGPFIGCSSSTGADLYMTAETNAFAYSASAYEPATSIVVTMTAFEVHSISGGQDSGWVSLSPPSGLVDLLQIEDIEHLLLSADITEGSYNQIRFTISTASVTTANGIFQAEIPSEKMDLSVKFEVATGDNTEIVLSIAPSASLKVSGSEQNPKYRLDPVLHINRMKNPN